MNLSEVLLQLIRCKLQCMAMSHNSRQHQIALTSQLWGRKLQGHGVLSNSFTHQLCIAAQLLRDGTLKNKNEVPKPAVQGKKGEFMKVQLKSIKHVQNMDIQ